MEPEIGKVAETKSTNNKDVGVKSRIGVSLLEEEKISGEVTAPKPERHKERTKESLMKPSGDTGKINSVDTKESRVYENARENLNNFPTASNLKKKTLYPIFVSRSGKPVGTKRKIEEPPYQTFKKMKTNQSQEIKVKAALKKKVFEPPVIKLMNPNQHTLTLTPQKPAERSPILTRCQLTQHFKA